MARRKLQVTADYTLYRDAEWDEYQVVPNYGTVAERTRQTYHTSDKEDAIDTMHHMQRLKDENITDAKAHATHQRSKGF